MEAMIETTVLTKLRGMPDFQKRQVLDFVEFLEAKAPESETNPLLAIAGMFNGGPGDTAECAEMILQDEINAVTGFTKVEPKNNNPQISQITQIKGVSKSA